MELSGRTVCAECHSRPNRGRAFCKRQHLNPASFHGNGGGSGSTNQDTKKGPSVAEPCGEELFRRLRRHATDHVAGRSHAEDAGDARAYILGAAEAEAGQAALAGRGSGAAAGC